MRAGRDGLSSALPGAGGQDRPRLRMCRNDRGGRIEVDTMLVQLACERDCSFARFGRPMAYFCILLPTDLIVRKAVCRPLAIFPVFSKPGEDDAVPMSLN
jgi:hypothetical protein